MTHLFTLAVATVTGIGRGSVVQTWASVMDLNFEAYVSTRTLAHGRHGSPLTQSSLQKCFGAHTRAIQARHKCLGFRVLVKMMHSFCLRIASGSAFGTSMPKHAGSPRSSVLKITMTMMMIIILSLMLKAMDRIQVGAGASQLTGTLHTVYRNPTLHATAACELPCNACLHLCPTKLSGGTSPRMERTSLSCLACCAEKQARPG